MWGWRITAGWRDAGGWGVQALLESLQDREDRTGTGRRGVLALVFLASPFRSACSCPFGLTGEGARVDRGAPGVSVLNRLLQGVGLETEGLHSMELFFCLPRNVSPSVKMT